MSNQVEKNLVERPPVVVIMGHIDHGKSTLLDYIRHTNIVSREAGGITQHLGAYEVVHKTEAGIEKKITFIDTPGHEAFTRIRSRSSKVADIAILIVSAEDGVKPQTIEALNCIKNDKIPFIVAINKIDSPKANIDSAKQSLMENEIYIEGYGGDVPVIEISAKTGQNIKDMLDMILLVAEMSEFRADPQENASGFIIESKKDKTKGISTTLIIKNGTVKQGQFIASCDAYAPTRILEDHIGNPLKVASFSSPVNISGWNKMPAAGSEFKTFDTKKESEEFCENYNPNIKDAAIEMNSNIFVIPIIIKADTQGSVDAIEYEISKIKPENARIKILEKSTGNIGESDVKFASGTEKAFIVGFGIKVDKSAEQLAEKSGIEVKTFKIIYELIDWLKDSIENRRPKLEIEEVRGRAKILKTFNAVKHVQIIGGRVLEGNIHPGNKVRVLRREEEIQRGILKELQHQKSKVSEVSEGNEFGASIEAKIEIAPGDIIEAIEVVTR